MVIPQDCQGTFHAVRSNKSLALGAKSEVLAARISLRIGVAVQDWRIQRMRTKWGSCHPDTGRILLNLELAKKPPLCLEYIVVHELLHLIERTYNPRFLSLLDHHLPDWQHRREVLNRLPVKREAWGY